MLGLRVQGLGCLGLPCQKCLQGISLLATQSLRCNIVLAGFRSEPQTPRFKEAYTGLGVIGVMEKKMETTI